MERYWVIYDEEDHAGKPRDVEVVLAADAQAQIEAVQQSRTCAETYLPLIAALLTVQSTHTTLTSGWCEDVCNAVKTLQRERDEARRRVDELESREILENVSKASQSLRA